MITPKPINLTEADIARFWSKVDQHDPNDCWGWTEGRSSKGYGRFWISSSYQAHRVAYVITNGDTELEVLHTCDHPWCCNPAHLYAGTQKDNGRDCVDRNRHIDTCGENHGLAKLTESNVHEIRRLRNGGWLLREIAEEYGISKSQVSMICNSKRWKHI